MMKPDTPKFVEMPETIWVSQGNFGPPHISQKGKSKFPQTAYIKKPIIGCESCEGTGRIECLPDDGTHTHPCDTCQPEANNEFQSGVAFAESMISAAPNPDCVVVEKIRHDDHLDLAIQEQESIISFFPVREERTYSEKCRIALLDAAKAYRDKK